MTHLTQTQLADALVLVARQISQGVPVEAVYVAEHGITILATMPAAARWRDLHGDTLGTYPLHVVAVEPLDVAL